MIFGKNYRTRIVDAQKEAVRLMRGISKYAFFPNRLDTGQWVWLEHYWRYYYGEVVQKKPGVENITYRITDFRNGNFYNSLNSANLPTIFDGERYYQAEIDDPR